MTRLGRLVSGLVPCLLAAAAVASPPAIPDAGPLAAGQILIEMRRLPGGGPNEGVARGIIAAPPEQVFRALTDYAHWHEFMPFLTESTAHPLPGGGVEGHHRLELPAPSGEKRYTVRFTKEALETPAGRCWKIAWHSVPRSGNLKEHRGTWLLQPFPGGLTLGTCTLFTDPGGATPDFAMNWATRRMLGWIFKGLRQQVLRGRYLTTGTNPVDGGNEGTPRGLPLGSRLR